MDFSQANLYKLSSVYMFYFCHLSFHSVNFIVSDCYIIDVKLGLALCTAGLVNVLYLIKATEMIYFLRINIVFVYVTLTAI